MSIKKTIMAGLFLKLQTKGVKVENK